MPRPLVFLDFDGVLNSHAYFTELRERLGERACTWSRIDDRCVLRLERLVEEADADIVVSSTWRIQNDVRALRMILECSGFARQKHRVIDRTPCLGCVHPPWPCSQAHRGHEIDEWLRKNRTQGLPPFVILDDDSDMHPHLDRLVKTNHATGLTDADVDKALDILRKKV